MMGDFALLHSRLTESCPLRYIIPMEPPIINDKTPDNMVGQPAMITLVKSNARICSVNSIKPMR